jgi:UDP-glucose 4-epimerase
MMGVYVVTGGNGFLGRALVARLRSRSHSVIIASRAIHHHNRIDDWVEFDLQDRVTANNITNVRPDGVFHLAWSTTPATAEQAPASDVSTNLAGTVNLLDKLATTSGIPIVLVSSGGAVYGDAGTGPISEREAPKPISIYGTTKLAMEHYATRCKLFAGLDVRIARISNPFGAGQTPAKMQGAATVFARKIIKSEPIEIWGDGRIVRDYVDVADVASGLMAIMDMDSPCFEDSPVFNIGSGHGLSLIELIQKLEDAAGRQADVRFTAQRNFDVPVNILDVSKLRRRAGWSPGDVGDRLRALVLDLRHDINESA